MMVSGPVGVGKTKLLRTLGQEAVAAGAVFLGADAVPAKQQVPIGVLRQVFDRADLPAEQAERASQVLARAALNATLHDWEDETTERVGASELHQLTSIFVELSADRPLVIGVDDLHFADVASLQGMLYLVQVIGEARVLLVLTESTSVRWRFPWLRAELLSQPHLHHVRLDPYSHQEVATVLAAHPDPLPACPSEWYRATGGNPRLLHALVADHQPAAAELTPAAGTAFGRAVLTCLFRSDPGFVKLARALAVFDDQSASVELLSDVLEADAASTSWVVDAATEAGLLDGAGFRHQLARTAVLDVIGPQERVELHKRVADCLYRSGAPVLEIARHKLAAQYADAEWSTTVLREAAERAITDDDIGLALRCLRLAERARVDEVEQANTQSVIMQVKWRLDPMSAERDLWELLNAARAGHLAGQQALALVNHLLWYGRPAEAGELFEQIGGSTGTDDIELAPALYSTGLRLAYTYPGLFERTMAERLVPALPRAATASGRLRVRVAGVIYALLSEGICETALEGAQALLQEDRISDATYDAMLAALETMVVADWLSTAAFWCDTLRRQAEQRRVPTWYAHLSAIRAVISYRQGDLADAEQYGRIALSSIPPRGFGVFVGLPLSVLLLVATRLGQYDMARDQLSVQVPEAMFQTTMGLHYLRARGRYYLARGYHRAAIDDFEACGDLMVKWGLDLPGIAPWRTDLAEANLSIGAPARELALDQLARLGAHNQRTRGISLRVLAAATDLNQRPRILREAIEQLRSSGDQLELADSLADLSNVELALGEYSKARVTRWRARQIATQSTRGEGTQLLPAHRKAPEIVPADGRPDLVAGNLSDAERRVAALAAQGLTNRQVAKKLYITVSTVEQHLTRVYRKLGVRRRFDLPATLLLDA